MNAGRWPAAPTIAALVAICYSGGCASAHLASGTRPTEQNNGYSLLYDLVSKESGVDKLLYVKNERKAIGDLIREIAKTSKQLKEQLEKYAREDSSLQLNELGLPAVELETRAAIDSAMAKKLLLSWNDAFEVQLLVSQAEAVRYATYLCRRIAKIETSPARADYLNLVSKDFERLSGAIMQHLSAR